ncbi:MAG: DNA/RNA non-specific endonuclease [Mycoplasmatales bacterium]
MDKLIFSVAFLMLLSGCTQTVETSSTSEDTQQLNVSVDACDTNGERQTNATVDVGFGDREYIAKTNEYAQLVEVSAKELSLQNESNLINGRYCKDEAKVKGTESKTLDEGHVIADSLGGVSNAYNITPENSTLNRTGEQAKMEEYMRTSLKEGKKVTNLKAKITYSSTSTQIPSHYDFTFEVDGTEKSYSFGNE